MPPISETKQQSPNPTSSSLTIDLSVDQIAPLSSSPKTQIGIETGSSSSNRYTRGMGVKVKGSVSAAQTQVQKTENDSMVLRKGPWAVDEDTILVNYVSTHGEGHWNSVARCAGLKRSGKSCRLRWLNYLRPDVRRGNITLQEQILILDLHSRWGNRWSKIAQQLPGRTDNEIKNYWRTRVIKQAKQLKCDVNSKQFRDVLRHVWMPRLLERVHPAYQSLERQRQLNQNTSKADEVVVLNQNGSRGSDSGPVLCAKQNHNNYSCISGTSSDSSSAEFHVSSNSDGGDSSELLGRDVSFRSVENPWSSFNNGHLFEQGTSGGDSLESLWNDENMWFLQQQLSDDLEMKFNSFA